jgi:hypothetical protein
MHTMLQWSTCQCVVQRIELRFDQATGQCTPLQYVIQRPATCPQHQDMTGTSPTVSNSNDLKGHEHHA